MRAQFAMIMKDHQHNIIFIEDIANLTGGMSITNDAENVFEHIDINYSHEAPTPLFWRVVYRDTNNEWWEMIPILDDDSGKNRLMRFEKWHGHEWDALRGKV